MVVREEDVINLRKESPRGKYKQFDDDFYGPPCPFIISPSPSLPFATEDKDWGVDTKGTQKALLHDTCLVTEGTSNIHSNVMDLLPDDLLAECLFSGYLDQQEVFSTLTRVCHRYRSVAKQTTKSVNFNKSNLRGSVVQQVVAMLPNLSSLDFSHCSNFTGERLLDLLPLSKTLRALRLRGACITDGDIVRYLSRVEKYLGEPSHIVELDLDAKDSDCMRNKISDKSIKKISMCCPALQRLRLGWCIRVSDRSVYFLRRLHHLRELDLSMTSVSGKSCRQFVEMESLAHLKLDATNVDDNGVHCLLKRKNASLPRFLSIRSIDLSLKTLHLLARLDKELRTNLELSKCLDLGVGSDLVYEDLKRKGNALDDYDSKKPRNSIWGF